MQKKIFLLVVLCFFGSKLFALEIYLNNELWQLYQSEDLAQLATFDEQSGQDFLPLIDIIPITQANFALIALDEDPKDAIRLDDIISDDLVSYRLQFNSAEQTWQLMSGDAPQIYHLKALYFYGEAAAETLTIWVSELPPFLKQELQNFALLHKLTLTLEIKTNIASEIENLARNESALWPDLIITHSENTALYRHADLFEHSSVTATETSVFNQLAPAYLKTMATPLFFSYQCLIYNDDIMKSSYFPQLEPTFDELKLASKKIEPYVDVPVAWNVSRPEGFLPFLALKANQQLDEQTLQLEKALGLTQALFADNIVRNVHNDGFNQGRVAMLFADSKEAINRVRVNPKFLALPAGTAPLFFFTLATIPVATKNYNVAKALLLSFSDKTAQMRFALKGEGYYPDQLTFAEALISQDARDALAISVNKGWMLGGDSDRSQQVMQLTTLLPLVITDSISVSQAIVAYRRGQELFSNE